MTETLVSSPSSPCPTRQYMNLSARSIFSCEMTQADWTSCFYTRNRGEVYTDTPTDILPRGKCKLRSKFWWLADRAIRITYRISLRSSSLWEPRHSLLKVIGWHYVLIRGLMSTYNILHPLLLLACNTRRRIYMAQPQVVKQTEHPKTLTTFGSFTGSRYTRSFACSLWQPQVPLSC
jgi:hypothetical protein